MKSLLHPVLVLLLLAGFLPARAEPGDVTVAEDTHTYTLDNGIVTARVAKASGDLVSLRYRGLEMLATFLTPAGEPDLERDPPGANPNGLNPRMTDHQYGFWSHDAMGPRGTAPAVAAITIDPRSNGGARAEVSVKGVSGGRKMGTGPGASADGQFIADIEIRYALGRGDSGVYTYCAFTHRPEYAASSLGEARFCAKLNEFFDWMSVAPHRNQAYTKDLREGDKYIYTVVQSENPVGGWSSTTKQVGFWQINPSLEYISGGPTKVEFIGHRDTNRVAAPCLLNYWRSSHYGGARVDVAAGEAWTKVVGPFFLYVNAGADPRAMYDDARAQHRREAARWPYDWVAGVDYPSAGERVAVKGRLVLRDPQAPQAKLPALRVGLTHPAYTVTPRPGPNGAPVPPLEVDWQTDAKHYQFWTKGAEDGTFEIPHVRPGRYTLHAFADGVLGEFARTDVVVESGRPLDLGALDWTPVRRGRQLWEIGVPNRNASEFAHGDRYFEPEISLEYAKLFPRDVHYVVGQSDYRTDWFFQHVPHSENPAARAEPFFGVRAPGRATPFTVAFDLPASPTGRAVLRLALCGTGTRELAVAVNGEPAGSIALGRGDGVITRHGLQGLWYEREFAFAASRLKAGANTLQLTVPAGPVNNGVVYDYLRLELDDGAPAAGAAGLAPALPTLWIAGDSTAAAGGPAATGWGVLLADYFDPAVITVANRARGGRSSRTFITEGHWAKIVSALKPGDTVLLQFSHNDGAERNGPRVARGSLEGLGDETEEIENVITKQRETLRTFGSYVRQMIAETRARGATPILLSLTVRNHWQEGRVERGSGRYGGWLRQLAETEKVAFIDHTKLIADRYDRLGRLAVNAFFPRDHVHTGADGARLNARLAVSGLKGLREQSLIRALSFAGRAVPVADPVDVYVPPQPPPKGAAPEVFATWLNLPVPADPKLPTVWLIGDSTVRNGRGNGYDGQFGWGDPFARFFYPAKTNLVNRAVGGLGARTFRRQWEDIRPQVKPGDVVLVQFGHNDNGARGALKGTGEETEEREDPATRQRETVHTFGWYLRTYIAEIRARGATPVICSLVPRNRWRDGRIDRPNGGHADWARHVAGTEQAAFLDLHGRIADRYDALGQEAATALFADRAVHTNWEGAVLNAQIVVEALRALSDNPLAAHLRPGM